jgi:hypothetical protein
MFVQLTPGANFKKLLLVQFIALSFGSGYAAGVVNYVKKVL